MILKQARLELTNESLKFFNQIGYPYKIIPVGKIKMMADELFISMDGGNSLDLLSANYTVEKLLELAYHLKNLIKPAN